MKKQTKYNLMGLVLLLILVMLITWFFGKPIIESHDICNAMNLTGCEK